jgi:hypothetical protein
MPGSFRDVGDGRLRLRGTRLGRPDLFPRLWRFDQKTQELDALTDPALELRVRCRVPVTAGTPSNRSLGAGIALLFSAIEADDVDAALVETRVSLPLNAVSATSFRVR